MYPFLDFRTTLFIIAILFYVIGGYIESLQGFFNKDPVSFIIGFSFFIGSLLLLYDALFYVNENGSKT